jgi:hypothetical protein
MRRLLLLIVAAAACPAVARAQPLEQRPAPELPGAPLGSPGQWVVTGASGFGIGSTSWSASQASNLSATFSPGVEVFIARNFSVGLALDLSYSDQKGYTAAGALIETTRATYSAGARLGVLLPLSRRFALYPRLTAGYESVRTSEQSVPASHEGPWGSVEALVLFVPQPNFFVGVVPGVSVDAGNQGGPDQGGANVTGGAGILVGGWFGGRQPEPDASAKEGVGAPRLARFGDAGVWVLNAELNAYGHQTVYSGPDQSFYTRYGVVAGADYFVVNHVSLGGSLWGTHVSVRGVAVSTVGVYTNDIGRTGASVRAGVELPLGDSLSLYPRLSLGYGVENYQYAASGAVSQGNDDYVYVDLYAPLLVHLARHFFVGFGPDAATDLSRTYTPGNRNNQSTYVGAGLMVGGWL